MMDTESPVGTPDPLLRLQKLEQRLRLAMEAAGIGIWEWDLLDKKLYLDGNVMAGLGEPTREVTADGFEAWLEKAQPQDRQRIQDAVREHLAGKTPSFVVEHQGSHADGTVHWRQIRGRAVRDAQGRPVRLVGVTLDVTDRRRAEEALRDSSQFHSDVQDSLPLTVAVIDAGGRILSVNEAWRRFGRENGAAPDVVEGVGLNYLDAIGLADTEPSHKGCQALDGLRSVLAGRMREFHLVYPCHSPDVQRWFSMSAAPMSGSRGGAVVAHLDITQAQLAEAASRESALRLQQAHAIGHIGDWQLDPATGRLGWSPEMYDLFGRDRRLGPPSLAELMAWYEPADARRLERAIEQVLRVGIRVELDHSVRLPNGSEAHHRTILHAVRDRDGQVVRVIGTVQDVTDRKLAEHSLHQAVDRLREFQLAINHGPVVVYRVRAAEGWPLSFVSDNIASFGYDAQDLLDGGACWLDLVEPGDRPLLERQARRALARRTPELVREYRLLASDGQSRWVEDRTLAIFDSLGSITHFQGMILDVSERKRIQGQLLQAQKMEAVGLLAGGIAHDFRNQLTVIRGYAERLLRRSLVEARGREGVQEILQAVERSRAITDELLAFSRKQILRPEVVSVDRVLRDLARTLPRIIGEDIRLAIESDQDVGRVELDLAQFQQAIFNLAVNARDAMPAGGDLVLSAGNVELDEAFARSHVGVAPGPYVLVSVRDTGQGVDPQMLEQIFEPFFTTKPVGEGTGLGLSMVHGFVSQSGGYVEVQSRLGKGTTFRMYFPRTSAPSPADSPVAEAEDLPSGSGRILVVEDEEPILHLLVETLGECGYRVLSASAGAEALELAEGFKGRIDLLVADVIMPGMDGATLARRLRRSRPDLRVLYISGYTGKALAEHGFHEEGVELLTKPFTSESLAQTVRRMLS